MKKFLLCFSLVFVILSAASGQEFDENGDLLYNHYKLPSIELSAGVLSFLGDVNAYNRNVSFIGKHNFGLGLNLQQRIGSFFGVSAGFHKGKLTGFDTRPGSYYNFQTDIMHADFNIYLHLDNDFIINKESRFSPFLKAGIGYMTFDPMADLKDANGKYYHYWRDGTIRDQAFDPENPQNGKLIVRDFDFETKHDSLNMFDKTSLTVPVGGGVKFKLSDMFEANIAFAYVFTSSNYIDNMAPESKSYPLFDLKNDNYIYSSVSLQFNIGGVYKKVLANKPYRHINFAEIDAMDFDKDGVVDALDKCPGTPMGIKVNEFGCPLDDDGDGIPNHLDKEPGTLPGNLVDNNGVTITAEMIEAKYIRDSLLMAGELILEKKYSEGTPIITDDYNTAEGGTEYSYTNYPYIAANWPDDVKSIPVSTNPEDKKNKQSSPKSSTPKSSTTKSTTSTSGVTYKVQIGASQKPLDAAFFKYKFGIEDEVSIEQADGWYRYTLGNFRTYKEARDFALSLKQIEGAFVVKYQNNKRVMPDNASAPETEKNVDRTDAPQSETKADYSAKIDGKGVYYRVQVGSSPNKLTEGFFRDNFGISDFIYEELVEGQYKYTLGHFTTYKDAKKYAESVTSVQGAFVISYRDNKRIPLQDAMSETDK